MSCKGKHAWRLELLGAAATVLAVAVSAAAQQPKTAPAKSTADVARGKYLVENVAMCEQCHTPRNDDGSLEQARQLQGAPVFLQPPQAEANWPLKAPRIGGALPAGDAEMVKLLTTGIWTNGQPLRFPMMPFRMTEADARAVVAYLKTIQAQP